jgi:hypothetical protein
MPAVIGRMSREGPEPHVSVVPKAIPSAEKRLCMNLYVPVTVCAWSPQRCAHSRVPCSARRALRSRPCWLMLPSVASRMRAFPIGVPLCVPFGAPIGTPKNAQPSAGESPAARRDRCVVAKSDNRGESKS